MARFIKEQTRIRILIRNSMSFVSSIGGGWASVRHARNARTCARVLHYLASLIGDETTMRRCRVFEAYSVQWSGHAGDASEMFQTEHADAEQHYDEENAAMCEHGLRNLLWQFGDSVTCYSSTKKNKK